MLCLDGEASRRQRLKHEHRHVCCVATDPKFMRGHRHICVVICVKFYKIPAAPPWLILLWQSLKQKAQGVMTQNVWSVTQTRSISWVPQDKIQKAWWIWDIFSLEIIKPQRTKIILKQNMICYLWSIVSNLILMMLMRNVTPVCLLYNCSIFYLWGSNVILQRVCWFPVVSIAMQLQTI